MGPCGPLNLQQWNLDVEAWGTYTPKKGTSALRSGTSDVGPCGTSTFESGTFCGTLWNLNFESGTFMWDPVKPEFVAVEPLCGTR